MLHVRLLSLQWQNEASGKSKSSTIFSAVDRSNLLQMHNGFDQLFCP